MRAPIASMPIEPLSTTVTRDNNILVINQHNEKRFYTNAIRCLIRKLDRKLLPFLVILEISSFMNRVSIGHTKLMDIRIDLNMTESDSNLVVSLFYIAHFIFHIPSNLSLPFIGPTRYLALSMFAWGSITIGMSFVTNARQLLVVRFLLGAVQAGFFPSIIIYFSLWYCKRQQIMRMGILTAAISAAGAIDGILIYGISHMNGIGNLKGWQWMFLIEGLPLIPLGVITYFLLDNVPNAVQWLNNIEKQLLTNLLRNDAGAADSESTSSFELSFRQIYYVFIDYRIYLYALILFGNQVAIKCLTTFLPTLVENMGYTKMQAHVMTTPPYVVACICVLIVSYSSSRRNEHGYHLVFCLLVTLLGFILMITLSERGKVANYINIIVTFCGMFSALPLLLSWLTNNVGGRTKRAMAISFVTAISQIGGIFMPLIYREIDKPAYQRGHLICAAMTAFSMVVTIILRICLVRENSRRTHLLPEDYKREASVKESCDQHPDVRYIL